MFILILYLSMGYGQTEVKFQEFTSEANCQTAIITLNRMQVQFEKAECIKK